MPKFGNSERLNPKYEAEENQSIDHYDEEAVLQQIPQGGQKVTWNTAYTVLSVPLRFAKFETVLSSPNLLPISR